MAVVIDDVATGLRRDPAGYWIADDDDADALSYPDDGNDFCFGVEEQSFWFAHRNRAIVAAIERFPPADGPFFDVGAGNGYVSAAIAAAGLRVVVMEPNPSGARNAAARGLQAVIRGTLPSPHVREGVAGAIGLFDVVEHVEDDVAFLASLAPYLRDGGRLYATVPAYRWLWSRDDVRAGHHRRYTATTLRRAFEAAGFEVEYTTYLFGWLPLPLLLVRVLAPRGKAHAYSARQHTAGGSRLRRLIGWSFAPEVACIRAGTGVPFGASCLAVARRR